ncbi:MAG TPA: sigma factor-like helix-turn-helix DNA-binding protein, partial [Gemmataceae bacterium]|nr:sigma factor-like helix-turn-helix DNA-binding protein [Gemmataceae bacterium]
MRDTGTTSEVVRQDLREALDRALRDLPERYRSALVLCYLEGKSHEEAARLLGCPLTTLRSRVARGRGMLRTRLTTHGLALSAAGLAALLVASAAPAAVPHVLTRAVLKAAVPFAAGQAAATLCTARVAELVEGGLRTMGVSKVKTAVLLVAGLLAGAGALAYGGRAGDRRTDSPAVVAQTKAGETGRDAPKPPAKDEAGDVTVSGRVLGPDGKPLAGARVFLAPWGVKKEDLKILATTDDDGRFRAPVSAAAVRTGAKLVAVAKGHGPDYSWLGEKTAANEFTLRLVKDDVPITGRVLDLEGRPIAGISVSVLFMQEVDLKPWLADPKQSALAPTGKRYLPTDLDGPTEVKTDKDGRFRLTGFGRDRVAHLQIRGAGIEDNDVEVITRAGRVDGLRLESRAVYPLGANYTVRPSKPIVGTVRDRKTGRPIAGIDVVFPNNTWNWARATTDEKGHYKIDGIGKQKEYRYITAGGLAYFEAAKTEIADTPGFDPVVVDFELDRGIVVKGRLTDAVTGQPVSGQVRYEPAADNPNLKDFTGYFTGRPMSSGHTGEDGAFTVLAIPGAGRLAATADNADAYAPAKEDGFRSSNALVRVNVSEKDEKSLVYDVALRPARSLGGSVTGPDGKPLAAAHVAGLHAVRPFLRGAKKLSDESFRVHGFTTPRDERVLLFVQPEKKLA